MAGTAVSSELGAGVSVLGGGSGATVAAGIGKVSLNPSGIPSSIGTTVGVLVGTWVGMMVGSGGSVGAGDSVSVEVIPPEQAITISMRSAIAVANPGVRIDLASWALRGHHTPVLSGNGSKSRSTMGPLFG